MATKKKQMTIPNPTYQSGKNYLYYGDNLDVLRKKVATESVDLCYIDPPFNSKRNYFQIYNNIGSDGGDKAQAQAFIDTWEWGDEAEEGLAYILKLENLNNGKFTPQTVALMKGLEQVLGHGDLFAYLVHMALRIVEIHRALKPTGSFYLHCDPTASHYLKLVCDSVFCADGNGGDFVNEITWKRSSAHGDGKQGSKHFGRISDIVLFYVKNSKAYLFNSQYEPYSQEALLRDYRYTEAGTGRRYRLAPLDGPGGASKGNPFYEVLGVSGWWRFKKERMEQLIAEGRIVLSKTRKSVSQIMYLDEAKGRPVDNVWTDIVKIAPVSKERLGYPTQKPEALLERIIKASSNEGDVVLDAYCGCGTSVAVAQRLNRRWIGIDITYQSISLILKRIQDKYPDQWAIIEANIQLDGVPRDYKSAVALANRKDDKTRKEFEKWAVLTYSNNQARINDKKGADGGIDGVAYFMIDVETNGKAVFQVKSGGANRATIATLNSDRQRDKAEFGFLITMDAPTKPMLAEVQKIGKYKHPLLNREDDRIQIVTIQELLDGARMNLPMSRIDVVKSAEAEGDQDRQQQLI